MNTQTNAKNTVTVGGATVSKSTAKAALKNKAVYTTIDSTPHGLLNALSAENAATATRAKVYREALLTAFSSDMDAAKAKLDTFKLIDFVREYMIPALGEVWPVGWQKEAAFAHYKNAYNKFDYALRCYKEEVYNALGAPESKKGARVPQNAVTKSAVEKVGGAVDAVQELNFNDFNKYSKALIVKICEAADYDLLSELADFIQDALDDMESKKVGTK